MLLVADDWTSIASMLECNSRLFASSPALFGEGGVRVSHQDLYERVCSAARSLHLSGIGAEDRVAIVMPPGVDLATAFLATSSVATACPLNPAYFEKELQDHLHDLSAKALIVPRRSNSSAEVAAAHLDIPVIEFVLLPKGGNTAAQPESETISHFAHSADVALVLHTSGTTSRPKRVPLTHANLCASARNISTNLHLGQTDISLSTMPLFHIHGLACLLAALSVGGAVICTPAFQADRVASWLEELRPTWLSAVPTALRAMLDLTRETKLSTHSLRFIRSSSAALPPTVMTALEEALGIPVIESYGMTEAAHQMASNPLPPHPRKAGSVGLPAGPKIAILDDAGTLLKSGCVGEVAIMGSNVMLGYENNVEANAQAFSNRWFRTGDQGRFDEDGYLFITGRLKEGINRGGEKIAPREIDEALLAFPEVRQAVAFPVPHASLGEDIVAAVVMEKGTPPDELKLRSFLLERLPAFKVPSQLIFLEDLPKGATGKVQRIGMAARLEKYLQLDYEAPVSEMEQLVTRTICEVLGCDQVGRKDNFFMLGGDSLSATRVISRLGISLSLQLSPPMLFRFPNAALFAERLDELVADYEMDELAAALASLPIGERQRLLEEVGIPAEAASQFLAAADNNKAQN